MRAFIGRPRAAAIVVAAAGWAVLVGVTAAPAAYAAGPQGVILHRDDPNAIAGQYIVMLKERARLSSVGADALAVRLGERYRAHVTRTYRSGVGGFAAALDPADAARLAADDAVAYVEQDRMMSVAGSESTPSWGLDRVDQYSLPLNGSYSYPNGAGRNVRIYIIDTGINVAHQAFGGRAVNGYDFVDNDSVAQDCNGHGTHVAGIAGGRSYGVAKAATLVAVRVGDCGITTPVSRLLSGVDWVTANAVRPAVANVSLGGVASRAVDDAVNASINSGVSYAVAAGNSNADACDYSPARLPAAITVGASNAGDLKFGRSNYGTCLDLFAPGDSILSAWHTSNTATAVNSGTSMSSPFVAGAAAVHLSARPWASPAEIATMIVNDTSPYPSFNIGPGSPRRMLWVRGSIYYDRITSAGAGPWQPSFRNAPDGIHMMAAAVGPTGPCYFAITRAGKLWVSGQSASGSWFDWQPDFLQFPPNLRWVTAARGPVGELELFVIDAAGVIYHAYADASGWHGWWPNFDWSPGGMTSLTTGVGPSGELELFATGSGGVLYHNYFDGAWHGWTPHFDGAPAGIVSVSTGSAPWGTLEVFAVDQAGAMYHNFHSTGGWHGWARHFDGLTQPVNRIAAALGGVGALEVFAIGTDGQLYHNFLNSGGWHGWDSGFNGAPAGVRSVTMGAVPGGNLEVFAVAESTGNVYRNYLNSGGWHGWERNFGGVPDRMAQVAVLPSAISALELFAIPAVN